MVALLSCDIEVTGHSLCDVVGRVVERTTPLVVGVVVDSVEISPKYVVVGDCAAVCVRLYVRLPMSWQM